MEVAPALGGSSSGLIHGMRAHSFIYDAVHRAEDYGTITTYLRMQGVVPPSTALHPPARNRLAVSDDLIPHHAEAGAGPRGCRRRRSGADRASRSRCAQPLGDSHDDGVDQTDVECAVLSGNRLGARDVNVPSVLHRERALGEIRQERVLRACAQLRANQVVDFRQNRPGQQPLVGAVLVDRTIASWWRSPWSSNARIAPVSATITAIAPSPSAGLRRAR